MMMMIASWSGEPLDAFDGLLVYDLCTLKGSR